MPQVTMSARMNEVSSGSVIAEQTTPLAETIGAWIDTRLGARGYPRPARKRLALLVSGLLVSETASRGNLVSAVAGLRLSEAKPESIARRLARLLDDPDLDPARVLPDLYAEGELARLLAGEIAAHAANTATTAFHHQRFRPLHLVVDCTTKEEEVVILAVGLAYRGIVLPLALRVWPHNTALAAGTFWTHLLSALDDVQAMLPPDLRDHVLLLADRGFGVPRLVDLANTFGWAWVLRVQGQVRVRFPDGNVVPLRTLAPQPGAVWLSDWHVPCEQTAEAAADPIAVFKDAGWRTCAVAAVWDPLADEPWLLISNLALRRDQIRASGHRWTIERLFLSWKSHGWDLEASQVRTPARVGRLLTGLAMATLWCLRIAAAHARDLLADLARTDRRRPGVIHQPRLPLFARSDHNQRPWPARFSLFTWGRHVLASTDCRTHTPAYCNSLPDWNAPIWSVQCTDLLVSREVA